MQKRSIIIFSTLSMMFLSWACTDWLSLKPENNIIKENYWISKENVHSAIVGCYASLLESDLTSKLFLWGEIRTDELEGNLVTISSDFKNIMEGIITPQNGVFNWKSIYKSINLCNTVLAFAKVARQNDPTYTYEQLRADEAEALGLRSLLYFYLARVYGDVPLIKDAIVSDDQDIYLPKNSQGEIIRQIINDLDTAELYISTTYNRIDYDKGRLTRFGINALQADVYLWNSEYENSVKACNKIINSGQFGLVATADTSLGNNEWFNSIFVNGNSNESIFEFQFNPTKTNPFYDYFHPSGRKYFMANAFVAFDEGLFSSVNGYQPDLRAKLASSFTIDQNIWKYLGLSTNGTTLRASTSFYAHWIVYRLADVLLLKAEALNQLGLSQEAINILYQIQDRAYSPRSEVEPGNKDELADLILAERQKELLFEGKRWFDVLRNSRRDKYRRMEVIHNMINNYAAANLQNELKKRFTDTLSLYFPLPQSEIDANPNLIQNKYYDASNH
jgi:starch-binding outer membrane protein, SusD/RagB family